MPRADLLGGMQVLLEKGDLKIAKGLREAGALVRELVGMRTGQGGSESGAHDDLVLAVALACWLGAQGSGDGWGATLVLRSGGSVN